MMGSGAEEESRVFRPGGVSYLRVPATDPRGSAVFYEGVFGWSVDADRDVPRFQDGTGHVIGHFMADLPVAGEAGVRPDIYVERIDETLEKGGADGGGGPTAPDPGGGPWGGRSGEDTSEIPAQAKIRMPLLLGK